MYETGILLYIQWLYIKLVKGDNCRHVFNMLSDIFFHIDHIIPAVKFITAVVQVGADFKSQMLMEVYACLCKVFVLSLSVCHTGVEVQYVLFF